nr:F-box/FBD/LRR-repeat protein At5g56420-like isoform X1 [Quercus suber]XP_023899010.1 F-box/FBD/LRR-repeat protein At5g56420-like isoform X1 [Quercus suber]XP_023899011.1 F-box/FBD/LRR-repeat protein At5g56420-like isoform X1 [Quercus suber]
MDGSGLTQQPKKPKLNEERDAVDRNIKCLHNLPEEILRYILSLLPTKDAIRTSVLCKRWEYLWTSIPNLDFNGFELAKRKQFMNFVERVLLLRDSSDTKKFTLYCHVLRDASHVSAWISAAVRRNVQQLYIRLYNFREPFSLPHSLFTCMTLTELQLEMPCILKLPPTICFTNLKTLSLSRVTFAKEHSTEKLFSGLPVLEDLELENCNWVNLKVVSISAPKLLSIRIDEDSENQNDENGCKVMISGVSLRYFGYLGEFYNEYHVHNSPSLVEASVFASWFGERKRKMAHHMYMLLTGFSSVKKLTLAFCAVELLTYAVEVVELLPHMPIFNNLEYLSLEELLVNLNSVALLKILQKSPRLKTMVFSEGIGLSSDYERNDRILDPVPPCFLSQLNCIKVYDYEGDEEELSAVKILLKNAVVLDKMVISCSHRSVKDLEKLKKVHEQLLKLPRGSKHCELVFDLNLS